MGLKLCRFLAVTEGFRFVCIVLLTHRLGREADEAVWELHEDAVGHDVFNPANQLHSNFDFREIFGEYPFLQRPLHRRLLGEGLY